MENPISPNPSLHYNIQYDTNKQTLQQLEMNAKFCLIGHPTTQNGRLNRLSVVCANWHQHTTHTKARFTLIGVNIQAATFSASTFKIWNSRERKV